MSELLIEPPFYVTVALLIFIAILLWKKVPAALAKALDARAAEIKSKLDTAEGLRLDAEKLLKSYSDRREAAEKEAADIVAAAKLEAERVATEARRNLEEQIRRRTEAALAKISQAEMQALEEVKATVADISIAAAAKIITGQMDGARADALIDAGIKDIAKKIA